MHFNPVDIFFEIIVLLFAICVHESAHAWMANRLGDPTAKMLGRVSLNPIVHIDPFGTIIMPLILIVLGFPPFGWAKPTPVDTRNFKNLVRDDILTAVAGPVSNFLTAFLSVIALAIILHGSNRWDWTKFSRRRRSRPAGKAVLARHPDQRRARRLQPDSACRRSMAATSSAIFFPTTRCASMTGLATSDSSSCSSFCRWSGCSIVGTLIAPFLAVLQALLNQLLRF